MDGGIPSDGKLNLSANRGVIQLAGQSGRRCFTDTGDT